ncbi:hypothetical protein GQ55_9G306100 [Panicum hallii var. hallii]|uniref:GDSL esterase/lipase n=1 Tax=Panicum hallii var. hallii TaxID=1504633 RepID=A0A2T7C7U1_9POAL|nr:hypothetical protein GQ55_9G306100 [Panicum hallii var. hallii]
MAKVSRPPPAVALVLVLVGLVAAVADAAPGPRGLTRYTRVFAFGNSLTDTGNAAIFPATAGGPFTRPPYGQTYFGQPSGRASDGRLIIDFLEQRKVMASSVFYVGEIGLNDYFFALNSNSVDVAVSLVPHVIGAIRSALTAMIAAGARTVVVTGMLPIGCEPQQLALFPGGPGDYDPATGCIARFNEIAERHNLALRVMLGELRLAHPGRSLSYADIYRAVTRAVASPTLYGFGGMPLAACCGGGGGPYNFNFTTFCSAPGSAACADPSKSISWDGIHFTEAANRFLTRAMLKGLL